MSPLDYLRVLTVELFVFLVAQTGATVWYYLKARRNERRSGDVLRPGVLPSHVVDVGLVFLAFAAEAVWQNVSRFGEGLTFYAVANPLLLVFANRAVWLITTFERRRYAGSRPRPRLPYDTRRDDTR